MPGMPKRSSRRQETRRPTAETATATQSSFDKPFQNGSGWFCVALMAEGVAQTLYPIRRRHTSPARANVCAARRLDLLTADPTPAAAAEVGLREARGYGCSRSSGWRTRL